MHILDLTPRALTGVQIGDAHIKLTSTTLAGAMDVITIRRVSIPGHSVGMVDCQMPSSKSPMVVEQKGDLPESVIMARSFHAPGEVSKVCILNMSNSPVVLQAGKPVGTATEGMELQTSRLKGRGLC